MLDKIIATNHTVFLSSPLAPQPPPHDSGPPRRLTSASSHGGSIPGSAAPIGDCDTGSPARMQLWPAGCAGLRTLILERPASSGVTAISWAILSFSASTWLIT